MSKPDLKVIACNYRVGTKTSSCGALAYVTLPNRGGGSDRLELLARSRGGRWINKWESSKRLHHFRIKTIPPEHPRYDALLLLATTPEWLEEIKDAVKRLAPS